MIVLQGVGPFLAAVDAQVARMRAATAHATAKALHLIERRAKQKLALRSHPRGTPTPSSPGEPPALVTGNLRRSITVTGPTPITPSSFQGKVGPTAVYGRVQELGGPTGRNVLPARPYLRPAYQESRAEIHEIFAAAWTTAILG